MLYHTALYYTILCCIILYYTIPYYTTLYYTISNYTILYHCIILYHTILYNIILYHTILYYTQVGPGDRPAPPGGRPASRCRGVGGQRPPGSLKSKISFLGVVVAAVRCTSGETVGHTDNIWCARTSPWTLHNSCKLIWNEPCLSLGSFSVTCGIVTSELLVFGQALESEM